MPSSPYAFLRPSLLTRTDPRLRVLLTCLLSLIASCTFSYTALLLQALMAFTLLFLAHPPLGPLLSRFATVTLFLLFLWLFTPFTTPGSVVFSLGPLHCTQEGLLLATQVTIKANLLTALFTALIATMDISTLGHALHALHVPAKLTFLLLFCERSLHLLSTEWQNLSNAARLRAFEARCTLHSYKTIASLLGILVIRSLDHAKRAHEALLLRGFNGQFFSHHRFSLTLRDLCLILFVFPLLLLSLLFEYL